MFTGLIGDLGTIEKVVRSNGGRTFSIRTSWPTAELTIGESIAVDGACLTVTSISATGFTVEASAETLDRTTLGECKSGGRVHLERALRLADRLGGHLVLGHVDAVGKLAARRAVGDATRLEFDAPAEVMQFVLEKGSITIDGVSLTVNGFDGSRFWVMIIPHTATATKLAGYRVGTMVNLEGDIIGKYVKKFVTGGDTSIDRELLERFGFSSNSRSAT